MGEGACGGGEYGGGVHVAPTFREWRHTVPPAAPGTAAATDPPPPAWPKFPVGVVTDGRCGSAPSGSFPCARSLRPMADVSWPLQKVSHVLGDRWPMCLGPFRKFPVRVVTDGRCVLTEVSSVLADRWPMCLGRSFPCVWSLRPMADVAWPKFPVCVARGVPSPRCAKSEVCHGRAVRAEVCHGRGVPIPRCAKSEVCQVRGVPWSWRARRGVP